MKEPDKKFARRNLVFLIEEAIKRGELVKPDDLAEYLRDIVGLKRVSPEVAAVLTQIAQILAPPKGGGRQGHPHRFTTEELWVKRQAWEWYWALYSRIDSGKPYALIEKMADRLRLTAASEKALAVTRYRLRSTYGVQAKPMTIKKWIAEFPRPLWGFRRPRSRRSR